MTRDELVAAFMGYYDLSDRDIDRIPADVLDKLLAKFGEEDEAAT